MKSDPRLLCPACPDPSSSSRRVTSCADGQSSTWAWNLRVLLLNQDYSPLNICHFRRAYVLVDKGKAEILESAARGIVTSGGTLVRPSVIRLSYYVRRPMPTVKLTRREIFARDRHTCQYCGRTQVKLTIDHVMPRRLGGKRRWENLVSACQRCNRVKGGRTLRDARMRLSSRPSRPVTTVEKLILQRANGGIDRSWIPFLPSTLRHVS